MIPSASPSGGTVNGASAAGAAGVGALVGTVRGGRRLRPRQRALELLLKVVLGLGLVDPGTPQLVGDEQEQQQPHGHQHAADRPEHPAHGRRG